MGILFSSIFIISVVYAEVVDNELPIGFTPEEWKNRHLIDEMRFRTDPPPGPVRNIAEFEPMQGVLIRYPFGISTSIIREMAEDVIVYCLVSSSQQNSAYNSMNNANVDMDNVEFILGPTNSYWTRDYGPWWVIDGNGDIGIVNFTYNRPRPYDDDAPYKVSEHLDVPYYSADFVSAGGNYMTDSFGISASTQIAYSENTEWNQCSGSNSDWGSVPVPPCEYINDIMLDYYGVHTYHVVADPNNEYIDHIDCWGKYLSPTTMLIREVSPSHPQYNEIESVVEYFNSTLTANGSPLEIFRVYTPGNEPYTNSLILNNKVFVPIEGSSPHDASAIAVYESAMPDHEILGFTGSWESTDALHCRAKGIPDLTYTSYSDGDLNMDESIDVLDVVLLVNFVLGTNEPTNTQLQLGDFNDDGILNILDIISLVNQIIG